MCFAFVLVFVQRNHAGIEIKSLFYIAQKHLFSLSTFKQRYFLTASARLQLKHPKTNRATETAPKVNGFLKVLTAWRKQITKASGLYKGKEKLLNSSENRTNNNAWTDSQNESMLLLSRKTYKSSTA